MNVLCTFAAFSHLSLCAPGTDATHAEHIETIKSRLYVGVQPDGSFVPGELGMGLVDGRVYSSCVLPALFQALYGVIVCDG